MRRSPTAASSRGAASAAPKEASSLRAIPGGLVRGFRFPPAPQDEVVEGIGRPTGVGATHWKTLKTF